MNSIEKGSMKRGEFLRSLGLSTSTLMAFYCLGTTMTACGSSDDDPNPNPDPGTGTGISGTTTGSNINFTVDLTNSNTSKLKTNGNSIITGDVLVAKTTAGSYVALSKICTHEGNPVAYRTTSNDIFCQSHGSTFTTAGAVTNGPATAALKTYTVTVSSDGNTLTVKA
ncbi:QcrA and Rieske domain-containing protein [Dyadobacter fermentans]|uniref:Rieske (2Fe-2S) domain protein n=1 Tax=Dyadobacter fermentans (strain ATCC 700827 / DSM 18053 / CIP 107007 / KCTC 52180 / NS114) TaxID=471854 RepID=C6W012_DYAFD|nr:Rieske (2Fe-2S) protein [Dyadobacter fermentans]ACT95339.1 Rieske (2Fe-2S) domain protein [Dyadobacter fermentans DSM 18053]